MARKVKHGSSLYLLVARVVLDGDVVRSVLLCIMALLPVNRLKLLPFEYVSITSKLTCGL